MIDKSPPIISFRKCTRSPSQRQTSSPSTSNVCQARDIIEHDHNPHMQRPSFNQGREPYDPAVCYLLRKPTSHRKTLRLSTTKILKRSQVRIKELLSRPFATISLSLPRLHLQLLVVVKPQRHCRAAWQEKATIPPTMPPRTGLRTGQSGGYVHSTSADLKPYQAANVVCIYRCGANRIHRIGYYPFFVTSAKYCVINRGIPLFTFFTLLHVSAREQKWQNLISIRLQAIARSDHMGVRNEALNESTRELRRR